MDSNGKMYSVKEVAAILGVSCDTVRRLIRSGYLQSWKLPKRTSEHHRIYEVYRVPECEVQTALKSWSVTLRRRA